MLKSTDIQLQGDPLVYFHLTPSGLSDTLSSQEGAV